MTLHAGVPQGIKLGPIIFLATINDVKLDGKNIFTLYMLMIYQ